MECGGAPPRIFSIDDYFMTEVEKVEKDPESGKNVKKKVCQLTTFFTFGSSRNLDCSIFL